MRIKQVIGLLVGLICVVVGAFFLISGYESSGKTAEKIKHKVTGNYSPEVRNDFIGGAILVVVGAGVLFYFRKKR